MVADKPCPCSSLSLEQAARYSLFKQNNVRKPQRLRGDTDGGDPTILLWIPGELVVDPFLQGDRRLLCPPRPNSLIPPPTTSLGGLYCPALWAELGITLIRCRKDAVQAWQGDINPHEPQVGSINTCLSTQPPGGDSWRALMVFPWIFHGIGQGN